MTDGPNADDAEAIVRMLTEAGLVEEHELPDGRVAVRLTERGRQLGEALPAADDGSDGPPSTSD